MGNEQPGASDPYSFEWDLGLLCVLDLLDDSKNVSHVEFQKAGITGIDDVVVTYRDGSVIGIQSKYVKAASKKHSLNFGDLICGGKGSSLISSLAEGWRQLSGGGALVSCVIATNKLLGGSRSRAAFGSSSYMRLPVDEFFDKLGSLLEQRPSSENVSDLFSGDGDATDLHMQTKDLLKHCVLEPNEEVPFLKSLSVKHYDDYFAEMGVRVDRRISELFHCDDEAAVRIHDRLMRAALTWSSSGFAGRRVDIAELETMLKLGARPVFPPLMLPNPLFSARTEDVDNVAAAIKSIRGGYVFLSGSPGSGKTTVMSCLVQRDGLVRAAYYAYRPLEAGGRMLAGGTQELTPGDLWAELFEGLQRHFKGKLVSNGIPLFSGLLDAGTLKAEVLRMAEMLYQRSGTPTVLVVDGLDHAARSGASLTFLEDLPSPADLPEGVIIVLGGQPKEGYAKYPVWLKRGSDKLVQVNTQMPSVEDVTLLVRERTGFDGDASLAVSHCIYGTCQGNALSIIYAVRAIEGARDAREALLLLGESGLSDDLDAYYDKIWGILGAVSDAGIPFLDVRLASILSLTDGRIGLAACAKALGMNGIEMQAVVARLKPLLQVTESGQLFVLNNDLLLYLKRLVGVAQNRVVAKEAGLSLAKALLSADPDYESRRWPIDVFLSLGEDQRALSEFTAVYAMEAIAVGVPRETLHRQAYAIYKVLAKMPSANACAKYLGALKTFCQHDGYMSYWSRARSNIGHFDAELSRFYPLPLTIDNIPVFSSVFVRAVEDAEGGKSLVHGWIGDLTPSGLFLRAHENSDFLDSSEELAELYGQWGRFAARWRVAYKDDDLEFEVGGYHGGSYQEEFNRGIFQYLCDVGDADGLAWAVDSYGIERQSLRELAYGAMRRGPKGVNGFWAVLVDLFADLRLHGFAESLLSKSIACAYSVGDPCGVNADMSNLDISRLYEDDWWLLAFLDGYFGFERDYSSLRYATMDDAGWEETLEWLRFHRVLGGSTARGVVGEGDLEFAQMRFYRLLQNGGRERIDHISSYTFDCWLLFASNASNVLAEIVDPIELGSIRDLHGVAHASLLWCKLNHGEGCDVVAALEAEFGTNGEKTLMTDDPRGRLDCYRAVMEELCPALLRLTEERVKWGVVGVLPDEDRFASSVRELYGKASERFPSLWASAGKSLFRADSLASSARGDRVTGLVDEAIYRSAARDGGFEALHKIREWAPVLSGSRAELVRQVEALIDVAGSDEDLSVLAALCLGLGCYFGYGEMDSVSAVAVRLKERAEVLGIREGSYPAAMTEALRVADEYRSTRVLACFKASEDPYGSYRKSLSGMDAEGLVGELRKVCVTDRYGGKVLCVLDGLSVSAEPRFFAKEIEEAVSGWLLETIEYASFSHLDEVVAKSSQIVENYRFASICLPDRGRDWFCKYNFCNAEGALLSALGIELKLCSEVEARGALLELCGIVPCWLSAAGRFDLPDPVPVELKEPAPADLLGYSLDCLLRLIDSCALEVRHSVMQGLRAMLAWCPRAAGALCEAWPDLTHAQKDAVFEVIESVDLSEVDGGDLIAGLLRQELAASNRLDRTVKLHCLLALQEGRRPNASLSCEAPAVMGEPAAFQVPINEIPRPAEMLAQNLDGSFRSAVLARLAFCRAEQQKAPCFDDSRFSLRSSVSKYQRSAMEVLYSAEQAGLMSGVGLSGKAALLLGSDTPVSFLRPPRYLPAHDGLEALDEAADWADRLAGVAALGIDPGHSVVGYQVLAPGDHCMYRLEAASSFGEGKPRGLLCVGDMALLRDPLHLMEPSRGCLSMVVVTGGVSSTWYSSPGVVISSRFAESAALVFDPFKLCFTSEGKEVLRYERLVLRSETPRYHVPYCAVTVVSRWVADDEWLSGIEVVHGPLCLEKSKGRIPYRRESQ